MLDIKSYAKDFCKKYGGSKTDEISLADSVFNQKKPDFLSQTKFFKTTKSNGKKRKMITFKTKLCYENFLLYIFSKEIKKQNTQEFQGHIDIIHSLCNSLQNLDSDFTILKLDFKNYYNSISLEYVYKTYLKGTLPCFFDKCLEQFSKFMPMCKAGIDIVSAISEYMSCLFLTELQKRMNNLVKAYHFVDDFIFVFNKNIDKNVLIEELKQTVNDVFYKYIDVKHKNKTQLHFDDEKFLCLSQKDLPFSFDFLGYKYDLFIKDDKLNYTFGLSSFAIKKFENKIMHFVKDNHNNVEKVRRYILYKSKFVLMKNNKIYKKYNILHSCIIFDSYIKILNDETKNFMQNVMFDAFIKQNLPLPYYLKDKNISSGYNLWNNFISKRYFVVDEKYLPKASLFKYVQPYNIGSLEMSYEELVKCFKTAYCSKS